MTWAYYEQLNDENTTWFLDFSRSQLYIFWALPMLLCSFLVDDHSNFNFNGKWAKPEDLEKPWPSEQLKSQPNHTLCCGTPEGTEDCFKGLCLSARQEKEIFSEGQVGSWNYIPPKPRTLQDDYKIRRKGGFEPAYRPDYRYSLIATGTPVSFS